VGRNSQEIQGLGHLSNRDSPRVCEYYTANHAVPQLKVKMKQHRLNQSGALVPVFQQPRVGQYNVTVQNAPFGHIVEPLIGTKPSPESGIKPRKAKLWISVVLKYNRVGCDQGNASASIQVIRHILFEVRQNLSLLSDRSVIPSNATEFSFLGIYASWHLPFLLWTLGTVLHSTSEGKAIDDQYDCSGCAHGCEGGRL
jgi:hypothetical protein